MKAQGSALGRNVFVWFFAMKGRNKKLSKHLFRPSGLGFIALIGPRALPWAVMFPAFQAEERPAGYALTR
jgi:hypothetical protein